jgi:catechol 2,3-dioxygenase-like lactoylglutathione lyase family enzyme
VIGRLEKTVIDCPDPRALAEFYCQVLGMRINEDTDGWVVIGSGLGCGSWPSSALLTGFRRAGPTRPTRSKCIWTSA